MPYNMSWYVDKRVILIEIIGKIQLEEFEQLHNEAFEYVEQSPYKVHAIADMSQFEAIPTNVKLLSSASSKEKSHKQGMTVLVMPKMPGIIRFIASIILQTLRLEYRMCQTTEEAISILRNVDADIFKLAQTNELKLPE